MATLSSSPSADLDDIANSAKTDRMTTGPSFRNDAFLDGLRGCRRTIGYVLLSASYEYAFASVVCLNMVCIVVETDYSNTEEGHIPLWVAVANYFFLMCYVLELSCRFYVYRRNFYFLGGSFQKGNIMDSAVIIVDVIFSFLDLVVNTPNVSVLRVMRLFKLSRAIRAVSAFPELQVMIHGLVSAFKVCCWGLLLLILILLVFGIFTVALFGSLCRELAADGALSGELFDTVWQAMNTLIQVMVVGDNWGDIVTPIVMKQPLAFPYFISMFMLVTVTLMNIVLAVIVAETEANRQQNAHLLAADRKKEMKTVYKRLLDVCESMDTDRSGTITYSEIITALHTNREFSDLMFAMEISEENMADVFSIMDHDKSGEISTAEFTTELYKMKHGEERTMLVFTNHYIKVLNTQIQEQAKSIKKEVLNALARGYSQSIQGGGDTGAADVRKEVAALEIELTQRLDAIQQDLAMLTDNAGRNGNNASRGFFPSIFGGTNDRSNAQSPPEPSPSSLQSLPLQPQKEVNTDLVVKAELAALRKDLMLNYSALETASLGPSNSNRTLMSRDATTRDRNAATLGKSNSFGLSNGSSSDNGSRREVGTFRI